MNNRLSRTLVLGALLVVGMAAAGALTGSVAAQDIEDVEVIPTDDLENEQSDYLVTANVTGADAVDVDNVSVDFSDPAADGMDTTNLANDVEVNLEDGTAANVQNAQVSADVVEIEIDDETFETGTYDESNPLVVLGDGSQDAGVNPDSGTYDVPVALNNTADADDPTAGDAGVGALTIGSALQIVDFDSPSVAFFGQTIEVTTTVANNGSTDRTADINLEDRTAVANVDTETVTINAGEQEEVTFNVNTDGDYTTPTAGNVETFQHGIDVVEGGDTKDSVTAQLTVGLNEEGTITANIQDGGGEALDNATVRLYLADDWDGSVAGSDAPIRQVELGEGESTYTFEELAVGNSSTSEVDYVLHAERDLFDSDSTQESLHYPDNAGPTRTLTLLSAIEPSVFGVGAVATGDDPEEARITGNTTAVFANGRYDSTGEMAVFTQTQAKEEEGLDPTLDSTDDPVTVDILAANRSGAMGDSALEFHIPGTEPSPENTSRHIQVTIDHTSPTANIDGNDTTGEFNYETFDVVAENASNENIEPFRTEDMFAWSTDIGDQPVTMANELVLPRANFPFNRDHQTDTSNPPAGEDHYIPIAQVSDEPLAGPDTPIVDNFGSNVSDTDAVGTPANTVRENENVDALLADAFYVVEGDRATQHEVVDVTNNEMHDGADVWAAYDGGPQTFDTINDTFVNEAGESFLVADEVEGQEGKYVIQGLVEEADFNVYVDEPGYNVHNTSEATIGGQTVSTITGMPVNTLLADYTVGENINESDGSGARYDLTHHIRETTLDFQLDVTVENQTEEFEKHAEVPSPNTKQARVEVTGAEQGAPLDDFEPIAGQEIELELEEPTPLFQYPDPGTWGEFVDTGDNTVTVTTDDDGVAYANWTVSSGIEGQVNVTAWTFNADNDLYQTDNTEGQNLNDDSNQGTWDIFTTGILTGDVLDDEEEPIISDGEEPMVEISMLNTTSGEYESMEFEDGRENPRAVSEGQSQYAFLRLPTGETYRVDAWITDPESGEIEEGFAIMQNLNPGTNTRDVVIEEFIFEDDDDVDPEDNPFFDEDGERLDRSVVEDLVLEWVLSDGEIDGVSYTRDQLEQFVLDWVLAG